MIRIINILKIILILLIFSSANYYVNSSKHKGNASKIVDKTNISSKNELLDGETFMLTDIGINHYKIPYLIYDQCLLRPEKTKIGSYSLEFFLKTLFICQPEGLLICYPSQLRGENSKNGTITSIPYRLINTPVIYFKKSIYLNSISLNL
uniref:Uncharacterized protein n=1 Tax=Meloidogyne enterolobii TaxID=390850 RepID=A0A6V7UGN5_MELEN|nr:unnamed protein product [Meloidogyne enterolobii]